MLNFVYQPISAILWFWHKVFSFVLNPDQGITWVLSIVFLLFTVRALLYWPTLKQMRSAAKMAEFQPKIKELQKKYKNDRQKLATEMQKLQKEHGVNPLMGCLPALVQMPAFLGIFHVLRSFDRTGTGVGQLGMTVEQTRNTPNYVFSVSDVQSFLDARFFGVPLSAYISMSDSQYQTFADAMGKVDFTRTTIIIVAVPMIIATALFTHFNARMGIVRQERKGIAQSNPQMAMMNKMMLWVFPATILFTGVFWHIGLLTYMLSNNFWTFFQQRHIYAVMDKEEEEKEAAATAAKKALAPKPGTRTVKKQSRRDRKGKEL